MKSDVIHVSSDGSGLEAALEQAESVALFKKLSSKAALHLRLLTEEMLGMLRSVTGDLPADFWIEDRADGLSDKFELHLFTKTFINSDLRQSLLSVSSKGTNAAAKGVMGKIKDLFMRAFEPYDGSEPDYYISGWLADDLALTSPGLMGAHVWSFNQYKSTVSASDPVKKEEWDELEKSVISNLADEVEIYIRDGSVEMVIYKSFS